MTYEQATADLAVTKTGVAKIALKYRIDEDDNLVETTEEVGFVTDEGGVAEPADVTIH